jgi:hypothetical protein
VVNKLTTAAFFALISSLASASYVDEIETINAQIQLVNKNAELQAALQKSMGASISLPKILTMIADINGSEATVLYPSGRTRTIKKGDVIARKVKVLSISHTGVEVSTPGGRTYLAFNNPSVTDQASSPDSTTTPSAPSIKIPSIPVPRIQSVPAPSGSQTGTNG